MTSPGSIECRRQTLWRRREEKEKKVARAGIEPTAAAPSQPTRLDVSRSDHSAASKETASWRALRQWFGLTRSTPGGWSEGERRERSEKEREQPGRTGARERRKAAPLSIQSLLLSLSSLSLLFFSFSPLFQNLYLSSLHNIISISALFSCLSPFSSAGSSWLLSLSRFFPFFLPLTNPHRPCQSELLP